MKNVIMTDSRKKKILTILWVLFAIPVVAVIAIIGYVLTFSDIPSFEELERPESNLATLVFADDGSVISTFHIENRSYVAFEELSPNLVNALVATEDVRYYRHSGIDFKSLGRVAIKTLLGGDSSQGGGSTLSQQLAKTLFDRPDMRGMGKVKRMKTMIETKLKEWAIAVKLERSYTKNEILTMYLNEVEFGSNSFGIKAAAQTFFSKLPSDLTIEESATLVGMLNKTDRYNPKRHYDYSLQRRNFVISQMSKNGFVTKDVCDSVQQLPIDLSSYRVQNHNVGSALYFRDMLYRVMNAKKPNRNDSKYQYVEDFYADSLLWAEDPLYGWLNKNLKPDGTRYNIYRDGLRIYTTINPKMQEYAEEAVAEHIGGTMQKLFDNELKWRKNPPFASGTKQSTIDGIMRRARKSSDRYHNLLNGGMSEREVLATFSEPQKMTIFTWDDPDHYVDTVMTPDDSILHYKRHMRAAFMVMTPGKGEIKAYVGGPDYKAFKWDNARQSVRQIGSTVKPFLYTLAMQEGMSPCYQVANLPQSFVTGGRVWTPRGGSERVGEIVTLQWGLARSNNNISAYLMKQFGPDALVRMMRRMGIQGHVDAVPPLCLGSANVSLYDMVAAFNTFPSKGVYVRPKFVTKIEDNMGNIITRFATMHKESIGEETAYTMVKMMEGVISSGTGRSLRSRYNLKGEMAGKTGTTNSNVDAWFIGYTPQLTAGAWSGFEDTQIHFASGANGQGARAALPIWGLFMQKVRKDPSLAPYYSKTSFDPPSTGHSVDFSCPDPNKPKTEFEAETETYFE